MLPVDRVDVELSDERVPFDEERVLVEVERVPVAVDELRVDELLRVLVAGVRVVLVVPEVRTRVVVVLFGRVFCD